MFLDSRYKSFNLLKFCRNDQRKWKNKRKTKGASLLRNPFTMYKMHRPYNVWPKSVRQLLLCSLTFNSTTAFETQQDSRMHENSIKMENQPFIIHQQNISQLCSKMFRFRCFRLSTNWNCSLFRWISFIETNTHFVLNWSSEKW